MKNSDAFTATPAANAADCPACDKKKLTRPKCQQKVLYTGFSTLFIPPGKSVEDQIVVPAPRFVLNVRAVHHPFGKKDKMTGYEVDLRGEHNGSAVDVRKVRHSLTGEDNTWCLEAEAESGAPVPGASQPGPEPEAEPGNGVEVIELDHGGEAEAAETAAPHSS